MGQLAFPTKSHRVTKMDTMALIIISRIILLLTIVIVSEDVSVYEYVSDNKEYEAIS